MEETDVAFEVCYFTEVRRLKGLAGLAVTVDTVCAVESILRSRN